VKRQDHVIARLRTRNQEDQRMMERMPADERGELNEEALLSLLTAAFPGDQLTLQGRGKVGTDILHTVQYLSGDEAAVAGVLLYECKDTVKWSNGWLAKAKQSCKLHDSSYVTIISRAFPRGEKGFCVQDGVFVVAPAQVIHIAWVLRETLIGIHRARLFGEARDSKSQRLHEYLTSTEFHETFDALLRNSKTLQKLLRVEQDWHRKEWARRQVIYSEIDGNGMAVREQIAAIIERSPGIEQNVRDASEASANGHYVGPVAPKQSPVLERRRKPLKS